jgi:hypothetical protein
MIETYIFNRVKGARGRPSRGAELISAERMANLPLPPARNQIPREISVRHQLFAMRAAWERVPRGNKTLADLLQFRGRFDLFYSVGVRENRKM